MVGERPPTPPPTVSGNGQSPAGAVAATPGIEVKGPAARLVANMEESLRVPTATTFRQLGVGALEGRRAQLNAALAAQGTATKVSFTHLIGYAIVRAVATHPVMGAFVPGGERDRVPESFRACTWAWPSTWSGRTARGAWSCRS
jgi:2-oxoglutarate dehydrogenase E1 component